MTMKKRFTTFLYTLLTTVSLASAQARFSANTENYNFGQIEWKHPVTAEYIVTNTGDQPLVLTDVEPDCACTVADWTQTPIAPGKSGNIHVTFDAEALGRFHKSVAIHTNAAPHLIRLYFSGQVVQEIKDFTRTHPYRYGDIRLDCSKLSFPDVQHGAQPAIRIGVANQSARAYEPILMHLPVYLHMEAKPNVLQPGEKGIITLTLQSEKLNDLGLTEATIYLSRFAGDKVSEENEIPVSAVLLPDFSQLSEQERLNAPAVKLSKQELDFSALLAKKNKAKQDITLTNNGRSDLHINKLQVLHHAVSVSLKKRVLKPGESTRLRVTIDKRNIDKKHRQLRLLMITNDPEQPKVEINIKAK